MARTICATLEMCAPSLRPVSPRQGEAQQCGPLLNPDQKPGTVLKCVNALRGPATAHCTDGNTRVLRGKVISETHTPVSGGTRTPVPQEPSWLLKGLNHAHKGLQARLHRASTRTCWRALGPWQRYRRWERTSSAPGLLVRSGGGASLLRGQPGQRILGGLSTPGPAGWEGR